MDHAMPSKAWPFVEQLVPLAAQLHLLLAHIEQYAVDDETALAGLLDGVLTPLGRERPADLAAAADVLAAVANAIESELFLAPSAEG
jgi:hypothetical protein